MEWATTYNPLILNKPMRKLLDKGFFYVFGRDKSLRPISILRPHLLKKCKASIEEAMTVMHYVDKYMIENMMVPGKIENWLTVVDLKDSTSSTMSIDQIKKFVNTFSHYYFGRTRSTFMLHVGWMLKAIWMVVRAFLDNGTREKINIANSNTDPILVELVHPSQLQKQYGGEAENATVFWPPAEVSPEYGFEKPKKKCHKNTEKGDEIKHKQTKNVKKFKKQQLYELDEDQKEEYMENCIRESISSKGDFEFNVEKTRGTRKDREDEISPPRPKTRGW